MALRGLIAAVHTPFDAHGELCLEVVENQLAVLLGQQVPGVFVCGSTGESHSLSVEERLQLVERWTQVSRGTGLQVIVHVGSNSLRDARQLASHAEKSGAVAISAQAPSYFKPRTAADLCDWCVEIAAAAEATPFYFYDIPVMTGVNVSMPDLLDLVAARIPNFAGLKFTNTDLMSYQLCTRAHGGRFDIAFGVDEMLLAALCFGAQGAVGSSYNFAAKIYHQIIAAFQRGDLAEAREHQFRSVQVIRILAAAGYMGAAREVMGLLGAPVGDPRLPNARLDAAAKTHLKKNLDACGFFDWIRA
jgi:N-acetylneuraminate lyase